MKLYFIRHGKAGYDAPTDEARPLTPEGIQQAKNNGALFDKMGIIPTAIYTSPRLRAQQTAQYIGDALDIAPQIDEACNFDFTAQKALHIAQNHTPDDILFFVGHNPSMSEVVTTLTGAQVDLSTCAVAYVKNSMSAPSQRATLKWLITAKIVAAMLE